MVLPGLGGLLACSIGGGRPLNKRDRAALVLQRLEQHYPETPIPLDHSDPFTLLIAVLLSAQCTDKKVNEVTPT